MELLRVNTAFAGLYKEAGFKSEMISQALLWERLNILTRKKEFFFVRGEDGYQGWVCRDQVSFSRQEPEYPRQMIWCLRGYIREEPESNAPPVRDLSIGVKIPVMQTSGNWSQVVLPDDMTGWIPNDYLTPLPTNDAAGLVDIARRFLGIPYLWGGRSGIGVDCSGLTQLVHRLYGIDIRRDAWMQYEDARKSERDIKTAVPGDLLFFSENGTKISHVGLALGGGRILHARGFVKINNLLPGEKDSADRLRSHFVEVKSFLPEAYARSESGD